MKIQAIHPLLQSGYIDIRASDGLCFVTTDATKAHEFATMRDAEICIDNLSRDKRFSGFFLKVD